MRGLIFGGGGGVSSEFYGIYARCLSFFHLYIFNEIKHLVRNDVRM